MADPLVAEGGALLAAGEHPAHQLAHEGRVALMALAGGDGLVQLRAHLVRVLEDAGGAAVDGAGQLVAVLRAEVARDHRAHGVAEQEVGQVGVLLAHEVLEPLLVLHHGVRSCVAPVAPGAVRDGGCAVAHVVVGGHDEAGVHERHDHMEVAAGMLAEAVDELHHTLGLAGRDVDPARHLVPVVRRWKAYLVQHGRSLLSRSRNGARGTAAVGRRPRTGASGPPSCGQARMGSVGCLRPLSQTGAFRAPCFSQRALRPHAVLR